MNIPAVLFCRKRGWKPAGARTATRPVRCGIRVNSRPSTGRKPKKSSFCRPFLVNCIVPLNSMPKMNFAGYPHRPGAYGT